MSRGPHSLTSRRLQGGHVFGFSAFLTLVNSQHLTRRIRTQPERERKGVKIDSGISMLIIQLELTSVRLVTETNEIGEYEV